MLIVRKEMTNEIVEYVASSRDSMDIEKYNMQKDRTHKTNKFINLNEKKLHDRYWMGAGQLFDYLVDKKDYMKCKDIGNLPKRDKLSVRENAIENVEHVDNLQKELG